MTTRRDLLTAFVAATCASPIHALAQRQGKVFRIGVLHAQSRGPSALSYTAFLQGMRELGYVAGKNLIIEGRYADGQHQRLQENAAELVRLQVDVIVVTATPTGQAAQQATRTIPIVITATADPVADGFAASLARPGGNITGMSTGAAATITEHLELLMIATPKLARVALLVNPANRAHPAQVKTVQSAASKVGVKVLEFEARNREEIERSIRMMAHDRINAVILVRETFFNQQSRYIAELAIRHKLASISAFEDYVEEGGLMSYGDDGIERNRRAAAYVDKILKGAKPGELPFEQPTKFYFAINRKTAKALGLTVPQELLLRADKVIE